MRPDSGPEEISVIVPALAADDSLDRCLSRLAAQQPPPLEVLIVADGGSQAVIEAAQRRGFRAEALPERRGPAATRNHGAANARGKILLFLDSDVEAPPDVVGRVAEAFRERPDLTAVFGSYDDRPAAPGCVSRFRNLLHHWVHQQAQEEASTFWAGCGAVLREPFLEAGGFDESFSRPAVEDIQLGHRLAAAGLRIRLDKELQVKHLKRWNLGSMVRTDIVARGAPWTRLMLARGRLDGDLNLRPANRASAVLAGLLPLTAIGGVWFHSLWIAAALAVVLLVGLNLPFYRFLASRGGLKLAACALPLHWLHFVSGLAGGVLGAAQFLVTRSGTGDRRATTAR